MPFQPLVIIPSYNTGKILVPTVKEVLASGFPVWVCFDGSTDDSEALLKDGIGKHPLLRMITYHKNRGKGATAHAAAKLALEEGFTHMLLMDADGQHPASHIDKIIHAAQANPHKLIMGQPCFGSDVPWERLWGRKITLALTAFESGFSGLADTLFGFRVYPIDAFLSTMDVIRSAQRYDFDPEIAVRMSWNHIPSESIEVPVRYVPIGEGGVSHFHYIHDNYRMVRLHFRLIPGTIKHYFRLLRKAIKP